MKKLMLLFFILFFFSMNARSEESFCIVLKHSFWKKFLQRELVLDHLHKIWIKGGRTVTFFL